MPWATVNAESENTRNSAGNKIRMTDSGQSRKEAAVMTTGAVSAKTATLIGFWKGTRCCPTRQLGVKGMSE